MAYILVSVAYLAHGWGMSLPVWEWDEFIYLLSVEPIAKLDYTEGEVKVVNGVLGKLK